MNFKKMRSAYLAVFLLFLYFQISMSAVATDDSTRNSLNANSKGFDPKSILSSLAGSLMSRGYGGVTGTGGSQVISLNLTNLVVLVLLKALIFAAGSLGAGTWKGGYARSDDGEEKLFTDEELLMFLSYLVGQPGSNGCLQSITCQKPQQAKKYVAAGDMLLKTVKTMSLEPDISYAYVLQEIQEAADWGVAGGNCDRFVCGPEEAKQHANNNNNNNN